MIAFLPELYSDELVYSWLSRYYVKSGCLSFAYVVEDLYVHQYTRPDTEFLNEMKLDVMELIDRYVKKGEKGIKIICPAPYKAATLKNVINQETGKEMLTADGKPMKEVVEVIVPAYKVGYTFDISQTEGEPLPEIIHNLEGELSNHQKELKEALLKGSPVPVFFRQIEENGYYNLTEKYIVVNKDLSERQMLKTLIHEIGHALLHNIDAPEAQVDLATKEVQAESIAYVVCQYFGMDTSEYSFGYISDWSTGKDVKELKNSLEVIRSTSNDIISKTEKLLVEIQYPKQELAEAIQDIHKKGRSM